MFRRNTRWFYGIRHVADFPRSDHQVRRAKGARAIPPFLLPFFPFASPFAVDVEVAFAAARIALTGFLCRPFSPTVHRQDPFPQRARSSWQRGEQLPAIALSVHPIFKIPDCFYRNCAGFPWDLPASLPRIVWVESKVERYKVPAVRRFLEVRSRRFRWRPGLPPASQKLSSQAK